MSIDKEFQEFKEGFYEWRDNHFNTLSKKTARIEGILWVLMPLVIAILVKLYL